MLRLLSALAISLSLTTLPCFGQTLLCGVVGTPFTTVSPGQSPFLGFTPTAPDAGQTIAVTAEVVSFIAQSAAVTIQGDTINVTLKGSNSPVGIPPPPSCVGRATFGPL